MPKKSAPKPAAARTTKPKTDAPSWRDGDDAQNAKTAAEVVQSNLEAALVDHITEHGATSRDDLIEAMTLEDFEDKDQINKTISDMIRSDALDVDDDNLLVLPKVEGLNGETNGSNGHAMPNVSEAFTPEEVAALHNGASQLSRNSAAGEGEALEHDVSEHMATRYLEHVLTPDEILALRVRREVHDAATDELQAELDKVSDRAKSLKKRIDASIEDSLQLSRVVRAGVEYRDVPCEERRGSDPREGSETRGRQGMVTTRLDTGECVDWRELRRDERQGALFSDTEFAAAP